MSDTVKIIIEIPKETKQAFDKAKSYRLKCGFYDHGGIIGKAIQNGIPLDENKGEWIPVSSIDEIPKEGAYWVTFKFKNGYRATSHIGWDTYHKRWNDEEGWVLDDADYIIAYMPYFEPEPYKEGGD